MAESIRPQGRITLIDVPGRVATLLDAGKLVTTHKDLYRGLTPENIRYMHINQESGSMARKQVLLVSKTE